MKPPVILSAIRIGEANLRDKHAAIDVLWRKFGLAIRAARLERGMSLKAFAIDMGFTQAFASMLEKGSRKWSMQNAEKAVQLVVRHPMFPDCPVGSKDGRKKHHG